MTTIKDGLKAQIVIWISSFLTGALKTPYSINLTVVLGVSSAVVILIIVVAIVCIRKRQRRRRASGVDDSSVVEYEFPLTDRKQD